MEDTDEEGICEALEENGNFVDTFLKCGSVSNFLKRDEHVYARGTTVNFFDQDFFLNFEMDVDGCVVELKSWAAIKMPIRHLTICNTEAREMKSFLKKHVDLRQFTKDQLSLFRKSVGFQLFYEEGWEAWFGVIPRPSSPNFQIREDVYKKMCCKYFECIRENFRRNLLCVKDHIRRTLMKNDMNDVRKLFVLPDDKEQILCAFQKTIEETELDNRFETINFCFRFGEKSANGVSLEKFDNDHVKKVTVHCAVDISSNDMELMWSSVGVHNLVGERGVLNTCLSFSDCVCYQSNLDGRFLDIKKELRDVCWQTETIRFIQLYVDAPHRRPKTRFHPVSGSIAGGIVFHKETSKAFARDATKYISTLDSNFALMDKTTCRIEYVCESAELTNTIVAQDCLSLERLRILLASQPLLVPLPIGTSMVIKEVGLELTKTLNTLLQSNSGTGNIEAIWKSFQIELATEKLLWGYPLCFRSHIYSVNLGPGKLGPSRSLTDDLGFLALERWTSCMHTDDSIPPCQIWTASPAIADKIRRTVGIHDILKSSPSVLGRRLLHVLIRDLYEASKVGTFVRYEDFQRDLYCDRPSFLRVNSVLTCHQLAILLSRRRRIPTSMAFGSLLELLKSAEHELSVLLEAGIEEIGLKYFPAFQNFDNHGNAVLNWNYQAGVWKLLGSDQQADNSPEVLSSLVKSQLELKNLVYPSRLKNVGNLVFPWIPVCLRKLKGEEILTKDKLVEVLCFISCVALIMNGWYVEYSQLEKLIDGLPIKQARLKGLEIQSKLLLSNFNKFKLFRLHSSIPVNIAAVHKDVRIKKQEEKVPDIQIPENTAIDSANETNTNFIPDDTDLLHSDIQQRQPSCLPAGNTMKRKWEARELEVLHNVSAKKSKTVKEKYEDFKRECLSNHIPFRTLFAFKRKLEKLT